MRTDPVHRRDAAALALPGVDRLKAVPAVILGRVGEAVRALFHPDADRKLIADEGLRRNLGGLPVLFRIGETAGPVRRVLLAVRVLLSEHDGHFSVIVVLVPGAVIVGGVLRVVRVVRIEVFQHAVGVLVERPGAVRGLRPFIVRAAEIGALGVVRRQLAVEHLREGLRELIAALASDLAVRPREQHGRGIDDAERQSDQDGDRAERDDERNAAPPSAPQRVPALPYPVHVCRLLCVMKIRVRQRRTLHSACSCCLR